MNVEILDFYPISMNEEKGLLTGTLRVKLPDLGIHILGVFVSKRMDKYFISLPTKNSIHHKSGDPIRYPILVFEDRDKQHELLEIIRKKLLHTLKRDSMTKRIL